VRSPPSGSTRSACVLAAWGVLAAVAGPVAASGQSLRGEAVAAETQARLPYTTVSLIPGFPTRFTDDSGAFVYAALPPGTYRLILRHIGYQLFDTVLVIADQPIHLRLALRPLAFELPPVTVVALLSCGQPGPPDPAAEPELAAIFDQLRENAARYRLLSDAYPFKYWILRRLQNEGSRLVITDTLEYRSDHMVRYAPGRLVGGYIRAGGGRRRELRIPNAADLADSAFHKAHCFAFGGVESIDGQAHLRVDFQAAARLRAPDVDGTAWLDSATHALRRLTFRLTQAERAVAGLQALDVTVVFGQVLPSIELPSLVVSITTAKDGSTGLEEQRLLRWAFLRAVPGRHTP